MEEKKDNDRWVTAQNRTIKKANENNNKKMKKEKNAKKTKKTDKNKRKKMKGHEEKSMMVMKQEQEHGIQDAEENVKP